ncbi:MAG: helix-turn-helix domain-containing protein [Chloroflexi bacterium]|nr:helix-turn-helix domain-containing protein [Chloroflexota bacterium]
MTIEMDNMLTVREAAQQCHRTAETIRRWVWSGKLPAQKLGNQLFIKRSDLARCGCSTGDAEKARRLALLDEIKVIRERIRQRVGKDFDILGDLDRDRESHP